MELLPLCPLDDTAANTCAGIACRLAEEIIRLCMNDYGSAQNFLNGEPFVIKSASCIALIAQKLHQIAGMHGMEHS